MTSTPRQGIALLMALATLVLVLAGVAAAMVALRGTHQAAWTSTVDARLLAGLRQGERLAGAWLKTSAGKTVLPPEGGGLLLVDDRFVLNDGEGRLTVTAYDGLAGIPAHLAQKGSALRTALPVALIGLVVPPVSPAQVEQASSLLDRLDLPEGVRRYPVGLGGSGRIWHNGETTDTTAEDVFPETTEPSLAEFLAVRSDGRINLNTAPAPLLKAAFVALRLNGVDQVLERRRKLLPSQAPTTQATSGLRVVAESERWQMLITVGWQGIRRSWWVDFASTPQGFTMAQRHDADN